MPLLRTLKSPRGLKHIFTQTLCTLQVSSECTSPALFCSFSLQRRHEKNTNSHVTSNAHAFRDCPVSVFALKTRLCGVSVKCQQCRACLLEDEKKNKYRRSPLFTCWQAVQGHISSSSFKITRTADLS